MRTGSLGRHGGRIKFKSPDTRGAPSDVFEDMSQASSTKRDTFGMPADDSDMDSEDQSSFMPGSIDEDEDDELSMIVNKQRIRPDGSGDHAHHRVAEEYAARPVVQRQPEVQPDYLRGQHAHVPRAPDDGFVGPSDTRIEDEKLELLHKIQRMAASGNAPERPVSLNSSYEDIRAEYQRMKRSATIMRSVKFQRRVLLAVSTAVEFISKRTSFIKLRLDGFSESVLDSIADYDPVFEECHEKYGSNVSIDPMWSLAFMFVSSVISFHISNAMFSSVLPSVSQTLANNPQVLSQVADAMRGMQGSGAPQANAGGPQGQPPPQRAPDQAQPEQSDGSSPARPIATNTNFPAPPSLEEQPMFMTLPQATRVPQPSTVQGAEGDDASEIRSVSIISDGGTKRRTRTTRKRQGADTLVL